jgi:hypothetical protein
MFNLNTSTLYSDDLIERCAKPAFLFNFNETECLNVLSILIYYFFYVTVDESVVLLAKVKVTLI